MAKKTTNRTGGRRDRPTVERRIMFYRVNCGRDDAGKPILYDPGPALGHVNKLAWDNTGRYQPTADGEVVCSWIDSTRANHRMRFAIVRRASLPLVEDGGGRLSPLNIAPNAGLSEITHISFFPNNILGAVFNFYGPRATRLASYLKARVPSTPPALTIEPLIRTDVLDELDKFQTLRVMDLKIRPAYATIVKEANDSLGHAFAAAEAAATETVEEIALQLSAGRKRKATLGKRFQDFIRALVGRSDLQENAKRFTVTGLDKETQRSTTLDLLSDKLISSKRILKQGQRSRALDRDNAYIAIEEAYHETKHEIEVAAALEAND
ncbi:MAG: hypothetical protein PVJ57_21760 [Phycisphaerae bacterium]